jgi:hypothetical protein
MAEAVQTYHTAHEDLDGACVGVQRHLALACGAGGQAQAVPQLILTNCTTQARQTHVMSRRNDSNRQAA